MSVSWTKDQKAVIEARGANLLVSAAAGSGKTAVLVERIIQRITEEENPLDIDRMLVMTFTKSAAAEIRERIAEAISKKIEEEPGNHHLEQQAVLVQYAQITTIDSFCLYLLHQYSDRLDIDPAFRIAEEGEVELLRGDAVDEVIEKCYAEWGERFTRFAEAFSSGNTDERIAELVLKVWRFSQSNPWPAEWLDSCRRELETADMAALEKTEWMQFLLADARNMVREWIGELEYALSVCGEADGPEPYAPMIREDIEHLEGMLRAETFREMAEASRFSWTGLKQIRGKMKELVDPDKKEEVGSIRKDCKSKVGKLTEQYFSSSPEEMLRDMEAGKENVLTLLDTAQAFLEHFAAKKREKNLVDFNDMEHFALEILGSGENHAPGPEADEMAMEFDEILVDEYQDSNLVQEQLIRYLSRERFGGPDVVMVGDVKQSIYKFRLARPDLFMEKYDTYRESGDHRRIELHQNFRSREEVLDAANDIFRRIMTKAVGSVEYNDDAALYPGAVFEEKPQDDGHSLKAELLIMDTDPELMPEELREEFRESAQEKENQEASAEDEGDYTAHELEAGMIAGKIEELTDPEKGLLVWDKKEGGYRRAGYGDIVILLRATRGWAEDFAEVLGRHGIPAIAEGKTGYFDTLEISTVLNVLRLIDNPVQDIPLAAVLRAPFVGITDTELALIAAEYKKQTDAGKQGDGLYGAVRNVITQYGAGRAEGEILPSGILLPGRMQGSEPAETGLHKTAGKLEKCLRMIGKFRKIAPEVSLDELIHRIFDETGFYLYAAAMPGGDVRRANLDLLIEKAKEYEETSYRGVFHFVRYIERLKERDRDFGDAGGKDVSDCVRIMTIHKSKGLEFPIVFVSGLGHQFNLQDTSGTVLIDADMGIGTEYIDAAGRIKGSTLKLSIMKRWMKMETLGEELRVLYVALTRAKEKLILTGSMKKAKEKAEKLLNTRLVDGVVPASRILDKRNCMEWILAASAGGHPHLDIRFDSPRGQLMREMDEQKGRGEDRRFIETLPENGIWDAGYRALLDRVSSAVYAHEAETALNAKYSVSELRREETEGGMRQEKAEEEFVPTLPQFMTEPGEAGGAARGTAYHRVLSLIPFEKTATLENVKEEIRTIVESGRMAKEEADQVDPRDILKFLTSPLGMRAAKAVREGKLFREQQFVMGIPAREIGMGESEERVLIQGIIDAFFEEDGALVLYDYKTDRSADAEVLREHYRVQLELYERALRMSYGKEVREKYLYSFRFGMIPVPAENPEKPQ